MTIILICLLIATVLPILAKVPLAFAMEKAGGYDNRHPRAQQSTLTGFGARAKAAHENSFEALIMFVPGALAVITTNNIGSLAQYLCIGFILARILYIICYLYDKHALRSTFWGIGFACSIALLVSAF